VREEIKKVRLKMTRKAITTTELEAALVELPGWEVKAGKLHKAFKFSSFAEALGWMVRIGVDADKMDHHPEWSNVYNRVTVDLVTHDLDNAISTWDIELARKMEKAAS
jgi:4a-hydroxytetrahydrobiopterin dehydratase